MQFRAGHDASSGAGRWRHRWRRPWPAAGPRCFRASISCPFQQRIVRREGVRLFFNVTYFDGMLALLLDSNECSVGSNTIPARYECRVRRAAGLAGICASHARAATPRPAGGHAMGTAACHPNPARVGGTPQHRRDGDLRGQVAEQRRVLAEAQASSKLARRTRRGYPRGRVEGSRRTPPTGAAGDGGPGRGRPWKHGCQPLPRATHGERNSSPGSDIGGTEAGLVCSAGCVHRGQARQATLGQGQIAPDRHDRGRPTLD